MFDGPSDCEVTEDELVEAIRVAFPAGQLLEPNDVATCPCEDCSALRAAFQHRLWPDVPAATIDRHYSNLPLFTPLAFRQFLPAYMTRGIMKEDGSCQNEVLEFTCYQLLPEDLDEHWHERIAGFTDEQAALIPAFLGAARARDCLLYTSPSPRDRTRSRMPSSA